MFTIEYGIVSSSQVSVKHTSPAPCKKTRISTIQRKFLGFVVKRHHVAGYYAGRGGLKDRRRNLTRTPPFLPRFLDRISVDILDRSIPLRAADVDRRLRSVACE
ncbi:hypothetical protein ElyMa_001871200 [Elysia marginata]|uniref:Uncharacterized protein n=1 Tax=Elysia marginata TaxID=1093978 RepID=A0AAV4EPI4_9GAST|nr:hypothetical protein ElyMa_001871200 [Elysia marginata]